MRCAGFGSPEALAWLSTHGTAAESVELKTLLACPAAVAAEALTGRAAPSWSTRWTYLLDTVDLDLLRAGVEVRLRRRARGRHDLAVSTRRPGTSRVLAVPRGGRVEFDVVPGGLWCDIEVRREVEAPAVGDVLAGTADPGELLSPAQRGWARSGGTAVVDDAELAKLAVHGPLVVRRVKVTGASDLRRVDLEHFAYPSGRELVELSTRCRPQAAGTTADAFTRLLDDRDVAIDPVHHLKTALWREEIDGRDRAS